MKLGRLLLGLVIVVGAVWVIVGEQLSGATADAVVNAQLSTLRTAITGTISLEKRTLGSRVIIGEELGSVSDPLIDSVRLNDLVMERDFAKVEQVRLADLTAATERMVDQLAKRGKSYNADRTADLQAQLDHARQRLGLLTAKAEDSTVGLAVLNGKEDGSEARAPNMAINYAAERVATLDIALRAAKSGVYLGDGYNDAPNSEQRVAELQSDLDDLKSEAKAADARVEVIEGRISAEKLYTNRLGTLSLASTVNGILWEYLASDTETLQRGQDVIRFVDCDSTFVTASVSENVYRQLHAGQPATFRMAGNAAAFPATVIRLAGVGAATIYQNLAVAPSQRHLERYDVALLVPALRQDASLGCAIGQTGRVFFDVRPLDWLRSFWR